MKALFKIVDIRLLKAHEALDEELLKGFLEELKRDGHVKKPILVEDRNYVILDGHHRVEALRLMGYKRAPVYLVDYFDDAITVTVWPRAIVSEIKKEDIIKRGLEGDLFPPKTSRHILKEELKVVKTYFEDLV